MKTRTIHKALSMLLTAAMVVNMGLTPVFAAEGTTPTGISGVCTHHAEHTEDCGYRQGAPCTHEHTDDCYTKELTCDLTAGDAPETATDSEATLDSGTAHTHGEDCYTKTDNCKHEHDEACGYTPDTACRFDTASCTECKPSNQPIEKVCTCPSVDSGELVHGAECPLYTAPELSAAVTALIAMVDLLPEAEDITEENKEATIPDFESAAKAYEALTAEDKAAFDATGQYKKLVDLLGALNGGSRMNWNANRFDPTDFPYLGELPSKDEVSALLEQMYQRGSISPLADEEPLETIEVDNSRILHRPADYLPTPEFVRGDTPATYGLIDSNQSGPFSESDERYFRLEVSGEGGADAYRAVKGKLLACGNNTNVWVADDTDFHAKTETTHDAQTCNLESVTYAMAKDLATGFDGIYSRMTTGFGPLELYEAPYSNLSKFGDLGDDEHVNILLYDIDALDSGGSGYVAGYFWNADMFDANQMFGDSEIIHPIDMFHVDIGTDQGWDSISGSEEDKLQIYGTLAHEFQHMLFFTHFGAYPNARAFPSLYYTWFNESLSGLADIYYVQPGAEIIDLSRTAFAASNPYDGGGYGDLFIFNSSMKNYGMGYLFSALFHDFTSGAYAGGVYDFFDSLGTDQTKEGFEDKFNAVNNNENFKHPFNHVGAMLNSGVGLGAAETQSLAALLTAYLYFMESFAADGGLNTTTGMPTQKLLRGTDIEQNLWALRPRLGQNGLSSLPAIPTLASDDKIIIDDGGAFGDDPYLAVTRDMMYKLEGSGKVINITVAALADEYKIAFPYLALPNPNSATGADIYPLTPGEENRIVTNGRDAYLFMDTFLSTIPESDNVTVTYTWDEIGEGDLDGTASIDNTAPRIGDILTGSYTGAAIAAENVAYAWYVGTNTAASGTDATYTVMPADLGKPITLFISDSSGGDTGSVQAVTAAVKKKSYVGSVAAMPTVAASTHNSVTLNTETDNEYSNGGATWQYSPIFNGLSPDVTYTFYCRVKETDEMEASAKSEGTPVKTNALTVPTPTITTQPTSATYKYGDTIQPLTITAADSDGAKLSYLWYENATDSTVGGKLVANTAAASYAPTVKDVGMVYYYCVVSKTVEGQTKTTTSNTAAVKIEPKPISGTLSVTGVSKAYDGNTSIVGTKPTISFADTINGETPTVAAAFAYDTATVGTGKTVNATNITLIAGNSINANYTLSATTASGTGAEISAIHPTYSVANQNIKINRTLTAIQAAKTATGANSEVVAGTLTWAETQVGNALSDSYTFTGAADSTKTLYWTFTPASGNYKALSGSTVFTLTISTISTGGGSSGGGSTPIPPVTPANLNPPTTAESNVNSKTDKNGNATAAASEKDITNAIEKAQKEAGKNGTGKNGIAITLNVKTDKNATALNVTLLQKSVSALIAANVTQVTVKNGLSTVTLDLATLKALAGGDVILTVGKADTSKLSKEAQAAIADRPVFQFGLTSGGKPVSDFKGGRVGLQIPYTPTTNEQIGNLCGVYIANNGEDKNGKLTWLEASSYDPITGMMLILAQHFSTYGIGYKQSTPKFTDVGTHWAKNDIDFVVARGLLSGTSSTTFAPETSMTRGMFVTALGRLAGVDTKKYQSTKFTDVAATAYYSPYVAWAGANNIVTDTSDTTFSPDKAILRQEMAVILVNYSKAIGYKLPGVHAEVTFTDGGTIASWAKDAVKQMQMAGILMGKSGNRFDPTATATSAEVSAMLRRYVELVASTETAEGWAMNESGQWMYIQDGKRVTGSKAIDGKSYTFDQYGVTTALPPERKYLTYTVQAGDSFWSIARKYKASMFELAKVNGKTIFSVIHAGDELKLPQK